MTQLNGRERSSRWTRRRWSRGSARGGIAAIACLVVMNSSGAAATTTVSIGGKRLQFAMPGNGWATLKYKP